MIFSLLELPPEIIMHILTMLDERSLGKARLICRALRIYTNDHMVIKQFPHCYIFGQYYLNEQAYHTESLLREIFKTSDPDYKWLVSRTTHLYNGVGSYYWAMNLYVLHTTAYYNTCHYATKYDIMDSLQSYHESPENSWNIKPGISHAIGARIRAHYINSRKSLGFATFKDIIKNAQNPGEKLYQVSKTFLLLWKPAIELLIEVQNSYQDMLYYEPWKIYFHSHNSPMITYPDDIGKIDLDNPWLKQYHDLYVTPYSQFPVWQQKMLICMRSS